MRKTQTAILIALLWLIIMSFLLCLPGSALPKGSWYKKIWFDKWVHIALFAIMVCLWCRVISLSGIIDKKTQFFVQISFYVFLYGIAMEFVQKYFIPNRSYDPVDILANAVGSGIGLFSSFRLYIKK